MGGTVSHLTVNAVRGCTVCSRQNPSVIQGQQKGVQAAHQVVLHQLRKTHADGPLRNNHALTSVAGDRRCVRGRHGGRRGTYAARVAPTAHKYKHLTCGQHRDGGTADPESSNNSAGPAEPAYASVYGRVCSTKTVDGNGCRNVDG